MLPKLNEGMLDWFRLLASFYAVSANWLKLWFNEVGADALSPPMLSLALVGSWFLLIIDLWSCSRLGALYTELVTLY